jgi:acetyl esterase/lipase
MRTFLTTLPLLILPSSLLAGEPKAHRDLPYAGTKDERQTLDLYAPAEGQKHPVVVWIHGGGWQAGDKKDVDHKPQAFTDRGFVFVSVNYRLLGDRVTIKQMAQDVARAIRWTHDHAGDFGGDPDTLFVMGHSAGAQLAALVCSDDRYLKAEKLPLSVVRGCVPVDGDTYDVPLQIKTVEQKRADIYKKKFGDEDSQKDLSPVTHVARGKSIPPFLILHVADHPETKAQSQRLVKALQQAGVSAKAYPAEGKNHTTINADLGLADDKPTKEMFEFLGGALKTGAADEKPEKPAIKKLGTLDLLMVETAPVVFKDRLYRFEYVRDNYPANKTGASYFRFLDVATGKATPAFARGQHLGCAFVDGDTVYAFGVDRWGGSKITVFRSKDMEKWEERLALHRPGWELFNTSVCKADGRYVMAVEVGVPFTTFFAESKDLLDWTLLPQECVYSRDKYTACPALRYLDGHFYMLYLKARPAPPTRRSWSGQRT